jgi:hypothetical protein
MPINFSVEPVDEKPKHTGRGRKGSKYAPIIEAFLDSGHELVRVDGTGKQANPLAMILKRIIKKRGDSIKVTVRNNEVYLEI